VDSLLFFKSFILFCGGGQEGFDFRRGLKKDWAIKQRESVFVLAVGYVCFYYP